MPQIISTNKHARVVDKKLVSSGKIADEGIGYYEDQHIRNTQEDALFWTTLTKEQLTSENRLLTPEEIAHRLWTSYKVLDKTLDTRTEAGTTASTTVYDGKGHLITATLADAAAFAVVYDLQGMALGVVRLNSVTHKPSDPAEEERIYSTGGYVDSSSGIPRVVGDLAVSRAIGDREYRKFGVCAEPTIDITSTDEIASKLRIPKENIGKIQVISTCDGFTDGARDQSKKGQEDYLLSVLKKIEHPGVLNEAVLAKRLVDAAKKDGSQDNISVAIQSITKDTSAFLLGVYDGHGGDTASIHVAENIGGVFANLCALSRADYAEHEFSINKNRDLYNRDNLTPLSKIVKKLIYLTEEYQRDLDSSNPLKGTINPILTRLLELWI